jgi:phenylacetate-CoA ligase
VSDRFTVSVVCPCLNEEANLPLLAERLFAAVKEAGITTELVIVDDGSIDGTARVAAELALEYGDAVQCVRHGRNRGIPASWRSGVDAARGTYVCLIDGDLQNPPEEVVTLYLRLLESAADLAQGTRSSIGRLRDSRLLFSRALNGMLNLAFGMRAKDSKSGFVLGPKPVIDDVITYQRKYRHFQTFISVAAHAKGYSILEVETLFESRYAGESFLGTGSLRVSLEALLDFVPSINEFRFGARRRRNKAIVATASQPRPGRHPYRGWRRLWFEAYFATMPLHKWTIRRSAREIYLDLKDTEWLSKEDLEGLQLQKLQRLLQHAYVHVPFYRDAMRAAGVHPLEMTSLDDIRRLPLLSKDDVRRSLYFKLFADNHRKREMLKISTSGSTGEPFTTYADRYQLEVRFAATLRGSEWTGWRFGDRQARLWHQTLGMTRLQVIRERIDSWFMRRLFIPAFEIDADNIERFIDAIRRHRPVLVDGYAESLNFLATYVREGGRPGFSPKAIMSSAQALPDNVRAIIEDGFDTKVYDKYGAREFSGIAYQCGHSPDHHVVDESYFVELIVDDRPARPGEIGEVVITDLSNFSVPLIRYRIGDLAVAVDETGPCPCGRHLSRIGRIEGRTQAIVYCANGTWLPGTFFMHFFKDYEHAVRFFQIRQDRRGEFVLKIVKNRRFTEAEFDSMMNALRRFVGDDTKIDIEFCEAIPLLETGKRSPIVSTVREDFQSLSKHSRQSRQTEAP